MKLDYHPVPLSERLKQIRDTISTSKVISSYDLSIVLDLTYSYITRIMRFHMNDINKIKVVTRTKKFYVYYLNDLSEVKSDLINLRYKKDLKQEW